MSRLTLEPEEGTSFDMVNDPYCVHFYESSVDHEVTNEPLVSLATRGRGLRLTREQVVELRDWLTEWLESELRRAR